MQRAETGLATPASFLLVAACATLAFCAVSAIHQAASEHRARREVACARLGAAAGVALGPLLDGSPQLLAPELTELEVSVAVDAKGSCVVTARAACGAAERTFTRSPANPLHCAR